MASKKVSEADRVEGDEVEETAADPVVNESPEAPKSKKTPKNSVLVTFNGGEREFSKEVHGDDFADLAAEFAESNNGTIA